MLQGAKKDPQLIMSNWQKQQDLIEGVVLREVLHVPGDRGVITEMFRFDWDPHGHPVSQVYQSRVFPGLVAAWSCHLKSVDRLFVNQGFMKFVLYDDREESKTYGQLNEFHIGDARPALLIIPTGVWHGLKNLGPSDCLLTNLPTKAYNYEDPDHYRLPRDTPKIPYRWFGPATPSAPDPLKE
ncbi:MAG: dTDP-4-dehydrorhamnose 3,5-epimerase [Terriglobia bacterium]